MKRKRLKVFAFHNFTVLSAEHVVNIFDSGWNLTSKMVDWCESDVVTEESVSMLEMKGYINHNIKDKYNAQTRKGSES
jgi:hypothetical protein